MAFKPTDAQLKIYDFVENGPEDIQKNSVLFGREMRFLYIRG